MQKKDLGVMNEVLTKMGASTCFNYRKLGV